jgi:hypothetical protein
MYVSDDYIAFRDSGYQSAFGKILLIDSQDPTKHDIFFDDNVDRDECIVDVRDLHTGS